MTVKQLIKILQEMPEEAKITIGDYDSEANVVTLMSKYTPGANSEAITAVNIDH